MNEDQQNAQQPMPVSTGMPQPETVVAAPAPEASGQGKKFKLNMHIAFLDGMPPTQKKLLMIGGGIFAVSVVLMIVAVVVQSLKGGSNGGNPVAVRPTPTVVSGSPLPTADPDRNPSPYANDPIVLSIESKVKGYEQEVLSVTVREEELRVPILDWNVDF